MVRKLVRHGDGYAVVIDKPIMELLKIDADTPIEMSTDGERIVITPQNGQAEKNDFRKDLEDFGDKYANMLKRLAD